MLRTSIELHASTRDPLKERKKLLGLGSMDEVVIYLLDNCPVDGGPGAAGGVAGKRARSVRQNDEDERVPQLLHYEILARQPKVLKWFTGLKQQALDWTMETLEAVVSWY